MAKREPLEWQWAIGAMGASVLATAEFRTEWMRWVEYRRNEIKKPVTKLVATRTIRKLEQWGHGRSTKALQHSRECGWTGVFEPGGRVAKQDPTRIKAKAGKYANVRIHTK